MDERLAAELLLEMKQVKALLQQVLTQQPAPPVAPSSDEGEWLIGSEAWTKLKPVGIRSASQLKTFRLKGILSESRGEIRNVSEGDRPTWEYHIPRCQTAIRDYFKRISA